VDWVQGDQFDAVMNYMWLFPVVIFFSSRGEVMSAQEFKGHMNSLLEAYPAEANAVMQNLLDSHDVGRVVSMIENGPNHELLNFEHYFHASRVKSSARFKTARPTAASLDTLKLMTIFQMTWLGAPMLYYGNEVGMWGGNDPDNRQPMLWEDLCYEAESSGVKKPYRKPVSRAPNLELHSFFKKAIGMRRSCDVLHHGDVEWVDAGSDAILCFRRSRKGRSVTVYLNTDDADHEVEVDVAHHDIWADEARSPGPVQLRARGWRVLMHG